MAIPAYSKTWKQLLTAGVPGKRIPFVSLFDTMQNFAFIVKDFLVNSSGAATKWTLKWSASAGVGPANAADGTDRIVNAAAWTPRATVAGASQAWMVLESTQLRPLWQAAHAYVVGDIVSNNGILFYCTIAGNSAGAGGPTVTGTIVDGTVTWRSLCNGTGKIQLLVAYQGNADEKLRLSYSIGGFTLAAPTEDQPTAADERVFWDGNNSPLIGSNAAADRIVQMWAADDGTGFRFTLFRNGFMDGDVGVVGLETYDAAVVYPCVTPINVFGFGFRGDQAQIGGGGLLGGFSTNTRGGRNQLWVSGVTYFCDVEFDSRSQGAGIGIPQFHDQPCTTQGGGWQPSPLFLSTINNANCYGPIGAPFDMAHCAPNFNNFLVGDRVDNGNWLQIGWLMWPNPSGVAPIMT